MKCRPVLLLMLVSGFIAFHGTAAQAETVCQTNSPHHPCDHTTIQAAISDPDAGGQIDVYAGSYVEKINFEGKAITLKAVDGQLNTFIDNAGRFGSVVSFENGERSESVLDGFTIIGGTGNIEGTGVRGGGISCLNSSPTIRNCTIKNNTIRGNPYGFGVGIYIKGGTSAPEEWPRISSCTIQDNFASQGYVEGGGIFIENSSPTIEDSWFIHNTASTGGGIRSSFSSPTITRCGIRLNEAINGGGVHSQNSNGTIVNCLIAGNTATTEGGGVASLIDTGAVDSLTNCTITDNQAGVRGGGIRGSAQTRVVNCILWNDIAGQTYNEIFGTPSISFSDVQGGGSENGNLAVDPQFKLYGDHPYDLKSSSPCINAGTAAGAPPDDILGRARFAPDGDGATDMGAYEAPKSETSITITKAIYDYLANLLQVEATSSLGSSANLYVDGIGAMQWVSKSRIWRLNSPLTTVIRAPDSITVCDYLGRCKTVD